MVTREHARSETQTQHTEHTALSAGALEGTSHALLVTALVGGAALGLHRIWPWLAWGYVAVAVVLGVALAVIARGVQRTHEREVEELRRRHRPE
jgi:Flp pilus assembly protein TadB